MGPLAGMQALPPFIPGTNIESFRPSVAPSYDDIVNGRDLVKYDRVPVRIVEFRSELYDMMDEGRRKAYEERMLGLVAGIQESRCVIWRNDLQILSRPDGQHWMRLLEWGEYELNEPLLQRGARKEAEKAGAATPKGVIGEIDGTDDSVDSVDTGDTGGNNG